MSEEEINREFVGKLNEIIREGAERAVEEFRFGSGQMARRDTIARGINPENSMSENETKYLGLYRQAAEQSARITTAIGDLKGICESLGKWRDAARELTQANFGSNTAWSVGRLQGLAGLRDMLVAYEGMRLEMEKAWNALGEKGQTGLSTPASLN